MSGSSALCIMKVLLAWPRHPKHGMLAHRKRSKIDTDRTPVHLCVLLLVRSGLPDIEMCDIEDMEPPKFSAIEEAIARWGGNCQGTAKGET